MPNDTTPTTVAEQVDQICELTSMTAKLTQVAEGRADLLMSFLADQPDRSVEMRGLVGMLFAIHRQVAELDERAWKLSDGIERARDPLRARAG